LTSHVTWFFCFRFLLHTPLQLLKLRFQNLMEKLQRCIGVEKYA